MLRLRILLVATITALLGASIISSQHATAKTENSCVKGICIKASDDGNAIRVEILEHPLGRKSHFNVIIPGRAQFELTGRSWTFTFIIPRKPGARIFGVNFVVQACKRRTLAPSICTKWSRFYHQGFLR